MEISLFEAKIKDDHLTIGIDEDLLNYYDVSIDQFHEMFDKTNLLKGINEFIEFFKEFNNE